MPSIYRKLRRLPIPAGAVPEKRRGVAGMKWIDGHGRPQWLPIKDDKLERRDSKWTIQYADASGTVRETGSGTRDERTAREVAASIEQRTARQRRGIEAPEDQGYSRHAAESIEQHVTAYCQWLADKGDSAKHAARTGRMIRWCCAAAKIENANAMDSAKVARAIRTRKRAGASIGNATFNSYVRAMRGFSRWLYRRKRTREDSLRDLESARAEVGRKLFRREVTPAELAKILRQAEQADDAVLELPGGKGQPLKRAKIPRRAWAYRIAFESGLRAGEIASLTPESFRFGDRPTIEVEAGYSKHRRRDSQPISTVFARELATWAKSLPRGKRIFTRSNRWGAAIKIDARAAGVPVETPRGTLDFHALRHSYASRIASVADSKTGQSLTRHASAHLYLNVYAKERESSRIAAVEAASMPR